MTSAGSCSTPTSTAARARSWPPTPMRPCCSTGRRSAARCAIEGPVEPVSDARPTPISPSRSRDSQLGAWASDQSRPLDSRATFEARFEEMRARFEGEDVPRPPRWSGFRVVPRQIEFWQDRAHRLHERRLFIRAGDGWTRKHALPMSDAHPTPSRHADQRRAERCSPPAPRSPASRWRCSWSC